MDDNCVQCEYFNLQIERDSLKEQLRKAVDERNRNYEIVQIAVREKEKLEADKAEAVRIAVGYLSRICTGCKIYNKNHNGIDNYCHINCERLVDIKKLESLTGQKWEEMRG